MSNFKSQIHKKINDFKLLIKHRNLSHGTTLIELLLYIGLLSIFLGVLTGLFGTAMDIFLSTQSTSGITIDSTYLLSKLKYDIQRAQAITVPEELGVSSSSLTLVIGGISHTYSLDSGGNLIHTNNLGSFNLNSYLARVASLNFTKIGNSGGVESTLKIDMILESRVEQPKGEETAQISTTVALHRNQ